MKKSNKVAPGEHHPVQRNHEQLRKGIRDTLDSKAVTIAMAIVTLWVLFGDDIRIVSTQKQSDEGFFVSYMICLILFIIELIGNSVVLDGYKFSFFFWLDVVAVLSMIPDIPWIRDSFLELFQGSMYQVDVETETDSKRDTISSIYMRRIYRGVRFIRLVRIVKLYKYFSKQKQDGVVKEEEEQDQEAKMDPRSLGKKLSDVTTRRVIIGVLLMLLLLPLMLFDTYDNSQYYGLQQIFWVGRSQCQNSQQFACQFSQGPWLQSNQAWLEQIEYYALSSELIEGEGEEYPLLWLYAPDFQNNGQMGNIQQGIDWEYDEDCSGKQLPDDCESRDSEILLVVYAPEKCRNTDIDGCEELQSFARFDMREFNKDEAIMNMFVTCFVGIILAAASVAFANDTQKIVIKPVTKMCMIIKNLADNPLKGEEQETRAPSRESMLEETIDKIGILLQMGFGKVGSVIMGPNFTESGELTLFRQGEHKNVIIAMCKIKKFTEIIDAIQEEVMVFVNKLAKIIHVCTHRWGGSACKNEMGNFLLIWPITEAAESLYSMIKIVAEIQRANDIIAYRTNPKIVFKYGQGFTVQVGIALHIGWIVQGPIGSELRVEAGYISPHLDLCEELIKSALFNNIPMYITQVFYDKLDHHIQDMCRKIDGIQSKNYFEPLDLYTFDLAEDGIQPEQKKKDDRKGDKEKEKQKVRKIGDPVFLNENQRWEAVEELFQLDTDVLNLQKSATQEFVNLFAQALNYYQDGSWNEAMELFEHCLTYKPDDGTINALKRYIKSKDKVPDSWEGYREF